MIASRPPPEPVASDADPVLVDRARWLASGAGALVSGLGAAVATMSLLAADAFGHPPSAAGPRLALGVGFALAGLTVVLTTDPTPSAPRRALARGLAASLLVLAAGALARGEPPSLVGGGLGLGLAGLTLLALLADAPPQATRMPGALQGLALITGLYVTMGHAYGVFGSIVASDVLARPTSAAYFLLCVGLVAARTEDGPVSLLVRRGPGGTIARGLLVPAFAFLALLRVIGQRMGLFEAPVGVSLIVIGSLLVAAFLMVRIASQLDSADRDRQAALAALQRAHDDLELRVAERTRQLSESEAAMAVARDDALAASRAKSEFLAAMSHELRTPLNAIVGVSWLLERTRLSEEQARHVALILGGGDQLMSVVNDVLDLSKIEAGKLTLAAAPFSPAAAVTEVTALLAPRANLKHIELESHLADDMPGHVIGDEVHLRQVLINLVGNAIKFTERGRIDVRARVETRTAASAVLTLAVQDTGIGIPADKLQLIFERFTQADASSSRRFGGTGLGLAISRQLVELMGGTIEVTSEPGTGSEFRVRLELPVVEAPLAVSPLADPAAVPVPPRARIPARLAAVATARALVVEDDPTNQYVARRMLELLACHVDIAPSGPAALSLLASRTYDIVYLDCQMPDMDGYEVARRIRAQPALAELPLVGLTAYAMRHDRQKCLDAGMNDYLSKPCSCEQLDATLQRWLGTRDATPGELDPERIAELESLDPDNRHGLLADLVRVFVESVTEQLSDLRSATTSGDQQALRTTRHKLKGACLNVGATHLAHLVSSYGLGHHSLAAIASELDSVRIQLVRRFSADAQDGRTSGGPA
jgi:signal transduction histidine kinase/DNA-binding response OmpR family regulator